MDNQKAGALWMLLSVFLFSSHLLVLKFVSLSMHPFQQAFIRNIIAALVLTGFYLASKPKPLRNFRLFFLRSVLGVGAGLMLNYANANAPLATVALLLNARIFPLTALAGYALQERIDSARWFGICVGFAGIFVVLMPNLNGAVWSLGILAALAASLMSSGSQIAVKALTNTNSALTVAAFSQLAFMFLSAPIGLYYWSAANVADIAMIGVAAAGSAGAALAAAKAFSMASASVVSPMDNTAVILASAMGFIFFGETPTWNVMLGAVLIFGGAYYVAARRT